MNNAHRKTLGAIFQRPVRTYVRWSTIESLIVGLGGDVEQRSGSRVCFTLNGVIAVFHAPHPAPTTDKGALVAVREFLMKAGIRS